MFSGKYIFSGNVNFRKRKIFFRVWLHFKKISGKYFLVFGKEKGKHKPKKNTINDRDLRSRSRDQRHELATARDRAVDRDLRRDLAIAISDRSRSRAVASSRRWSRDRAGEIAISNRDRWWYFSWVCVFLFLFQTPENIFRKIFWNATKHGKIFSFSGN